MGCNPTGRFVSFSGRVTPHITRTIFLYILTFMKTLLVISIIGVGFSLAGCIVPVDVERRHDHRHYNDGRNGYPVRVDVVPVIDVRR